MALAQEGIRSRGCGCGWRVFQALRQRQREVSPSKSALRGAGPCLHPARLLALFGSQGRLSFAGAPSAKGVASRWPPARRPPVRPWISSSYHISQHLHPGCAFWPGQPPPPHPCSNPWSARRQLPRCPLRESFPSATSLSISPWSRCPPSSEPGHRPTPAPPDFPPALTAQACWA